MVPRSNRCAFGRWRRSAALACATALWLAGCAGGAGIEPESGTLAAPAQTLNSGFGEGTGNGNVASVYARIARGLNRCWLIAGGRLHGTHILHAEVAPPPANTAAITLHRRTATGRHGVKMISFALAGDGDSTHVVATNHRLADDIAGPVTADVLRWARGGDDCGATNGANISVDPAAVKAGKARKPKI